MLPFNMRRLDRRGPAVSEEGRTGERLDRRYLAASTVGHALVLVLILMPFAWEPDDAAVPLVVPVVELAGASGAAGAQAGAGAGEDQRTAETTPLSDVEQADGASGAPMAAAAAADVTPAVNAEEALPAPRPRPVVSAQPEAPRVAEASIEPAPLPLPPTPRPAIQRPSPRAKPPAARNVEPRERQVATARPPAAGAHRQSQATDGAGTGEHEGFGSVGRQVGGAYGGGEGPGDDYFDRLRRWLAKYKQYPRQAVQRKEEGTVLVEFVLARDGTVLNAHIVRSSGYPLLDRAVFDMLRRASPVPPLPPGFPGDRGRIEMPIAFSISLFDRLFGG